MTTQLIRSFVFLTSFLLMMLSVGAPVSAAPHQRGIAFFSLLSPQFPCDDALKIFDSTPLPALAILWGTFGTDTACLKKWFAMFPSSQHTLEVHLFNGPCLRNNRCEASEFGAGLTPRELNSLIESRDAKILNNLSERIDAIKVAIEKLARPSDELILSTGLEDNFTPKAYQIVATLVKERWPYSIVRNPVGNLREKGSTGADYIELHGSAPNFAADALCIANLDGTDISMPHRMGIPPRPISWEEAQLFVRKYEQQCRVTFLWAGEWQGLIRGEFAVPSKRRLVVDERDVRLVREFLASTHR